MLRVFMEDERFYPEVIVAMSEAFDAALQST
jgi:hypothetical protein